LGTQIDLGRSSVTGKRETALSATLAAPRHLHNHLALID
jgi:hypothetical protein